MVLGCLCRATDEAAIKKASGKTNLWQWCQKWRHSDKTQEALRSNLIGSSETIRQRLRQFAEAYVDQMTLLNQASTNTYEDICASLQFFAPRGKAGVSHPSGAARHLESYSAGR
jgi:hypothetical protein